MAKCQYSIHTFESDYVLHMVCLKCKGGINRAISLLNTLLLANENHHLQKCHQNCPRKLDDEVHAVIRCNSGIFLFDRFPVPSPCSHLGLTYRRTCHLCWCTCCCRRGYCSRYCGGSEECSCGFACMFLASARTSLPSSTPS